MSDDHWFVPGGAVVSDDGAMLRLHPPPDWHRIVIEVWQVPPSMNTDESRGWRQFYRHKRAWQSEIEILLMQRRVTRFHYQRAIAGAFIRFPRRAARRDPGNFSGLVGKALGDALVTRGAIPDDDAAHYAFSGVEFFLDLGPPRTSIHIFLQPPEEG